MSIKSSISKFLKCIFAFFAGALMGLPLASYAQSTTYPEKPIRVIVPFGAGSGTDVMARLVTDEMRIRLGQSFIVEPRPGANGFIAAELAAKSAPDGYTVFITSSTTHSTNPSLFRKLPYDPIKDFTPVGGLVHAYYAIAVNNEVPVKTLAELAAWLKANPDKASYGWGATISQLGAAAYLNRIGVSAVGIPYKSSPQAVTDLIGGRLTFMVMDLTSGIPHIKGGRVRALAITSPQRLSEIPAVPTLAEAGLPGFPLPSWIGMYVPAGTPEPIVQKLNSALQEVLKTPSVIKRIHDCCMAQTFPSTPAQFGDYVAKDRELWASRITAVGISPE